MHVSFSKFHRLIQSGVYPFLVLGTLLPLSAIADTSLYLSPVASNPAIGTEFHLRAFVDSGETSLNAVEGVLRYDPSKFHFLRAETADSILNSWTISPIANEGTGELPFAGMASSVYVGSHGFLLDAVFEPTGVGEGEFVFDSGAAVHAADGSGTNVLTSLGRAAYRVIPSGGAGSGAFSDVGDGEPTGVGEVAGATIAQTERTIVSSSHPDPERWYSATSSTLSWKLEENIAELRMGLSSDPDGTASVRYAPPVATKTLTDLDQGVSYFHLLSISKDSSATIEHFPFRIDSAPPEQFSVELIDRNDSTDPNIAFFVVATDTLSGIDRMEFSLDGGMATAWSDDGTHRYTITGLANGTHVLLAHAIDRAGNTVSQEIEFVLEGISAPSLTSEKSVWKAGETMSLVGSAPPESTVAISISRNGEILLSAEIIADRNGAFTWTDAAPLDPGPLLVSAIASDARGARSDPSQELTLEIAPGAFDILARHPLIPSGIGILVLVASLAGWFMLRRAKHEYDDESPVEEAGVDIVGNALSASSRINSKSAGEDGVAMRTGGEKNTTGLVVTLGSRSRK